MTHFFPNVIEAQWPHLFLNAAQWLTKYYVNLQAQLKLVDPILLGGNSVFWVPSGMNLIPRYALLHLASLGFRNRLRSVSNSSPQGPQKLNFPLRKMDSPVFDTYQLTKLILCFRYLGYSNVQSSRPSVWFRDPGSSRYPDFQSIIISLLASR